MPSAEMSKHKEGKVEKQNKEITIEYKPRTEYGKLGNFSYSW